MKLQTQDNSKEMLAILSQIEKLAQSTGLFGTIQNCDLLYGIRKNLK